MVGKPVRCPKCHEHFIFAPTAPSRSGQSTGSEQPVTDTGVMRILGDMPAPQPTTKNEVAARPCSRCGNAIPETTAVCSHCNCYVGVLPTFLQALAHEGQTERS